MAWLLLTIGGLLAGQMIYRWKKDIVLTTVVTVIIALAGLRWEHCAFQYDHRGVPGQQPVAVGDRAFVFCYFAAVLPIWRFALPINYVASYIVFLGSSSGSLECSSFIPTLTFLPIPASPSE